jgi:hypothetical protein
MINCLLEVLPTMLVLALPVLIAIMINKEDKKNVDEDENK